MFNFFISFILFISCSVFAESKKVDLLILDGTIVTMDPERSLIQHGGIAIDQGNIIALGSMDQIQKEYTAEKVIDAHGKAIIPGLINGHCHTPMSLFRSLADDKELHDWLNYIFPAEVKNVNEEFVRAGTRLGLAEMIKGGTTTFVDMYFFEDAMAEEAAKAGMRGVLGQGLLDYPTPDSKTFIEGMARAKQLIEKWHNHPLITPALAPHATYTVSGEHLKEISALAKESKAPIIIHLCETKEEVSKIKKEKGASPILYLNQLGVFDTHVIAAHLVHVSDEEIEILKDKQVGVIHNPHSNMKLASGVAPIDQMLKAGINIGLGTDGAASNNNLSIWDEMDITAKLHKVTGENAALVTAIEAFEMATIGGARALKMEKEIGSLEKGKKADLVIVDLDGLHQIPSYNIYSTLIYATTSSDVNTVIINGQIVMQERKLLTLDEKTIKEQTEFYRNRVKSSLEE